jgi:CubicO group peptidase (beta-lactamase class C family)
MRTASLFICALTPICTSSMGVSDLTDSLQKIIAAGAEQDNISYSFAVVLSEQSSVAVAAGADDRVSGRAVTTESRYPAGSVTKPYTAVAAMRLHDSGKLDLGRPVHTYLDPWFAAQSLPPLLHMWGNDTAILKVTSRHLLGMQGGFSDYEDGWLKNWTINHAEADYTPLEFIRDLDKTFLFAPGKGASYSGDSFVLMGLVLTAVTGGKTWSDFDQLGALGPGRNHI